MKASVFVLVGLTIIVVALTPYIVGGVLLAGIVHQAARWRREARERSRDAVALDALRSLANGPQRGAWPLYSGVLSPSDPAWYDRAGR